MKQTYYQTGLNFQLFTILHGCICKTHDISQLCLEFVSFIRAHKFMLPLSLTQCGRVGGFSKMLLPIIFLILPVLKGDFLVDFLFINLNLFSCVCLRGWLDIVRGAMLEGGGNSNQLCRSLNSVCQSCQLTKD